MEMCKSSDMTLISQPENIRTKRLSLGEAAKLIHRDEETNSYMQTLDTRVWLVQMDGQLLLVGGPPPAPTEVGQVATPTPPQPFWGTCSVILVADTGRGIEISEK